MPLHCTRRAHLQTQCTLHSGVYGLFFPHTNENAPSPGTERNDHRVYIARNAQRTFSRSTVYTNSYAEGTSALLSAWRTGERTHLIDLRTTSNAVAGRLSPSIVK